MTFSELSQDLLSPDIQRLALVVLALFLLFPLDRPLGRFSGDVRGTILWKVLISCATYIFFLLLPFTKLLGQNDRLQNDSLH